MQNLKFFLSLILLLFFYRAMTFNKEWKDYNLEESLNENFFRDSNICIDTVNQGVTNINFDKSFLSKEQIDSIYQSIYAPISDTYEFSIKKHGKRQFTILGLNNADGIYLVDHDDYNALVSAILPPRGTGGNLTTMRFSKNSGLDSSDSIINYCNIVYIIDTIKCTDHKISKVRLYDIIDTVPIRINETAPQEVLQFLRRDNLIPELDSVVHKIDIKYSPKLESILQLYRIDVDIEESRDTKNQFYILICYKGHYFLCPNWRYETWRDFFSLVSLYDKKYPHLPSPIPEVDEENISHVLDSLSDIKWIRIGDFNYSPRLYKRLIDAGKN